MPRFFFDVLDGRCEADEIGQVYLDERQARREAIRRAAILMRVTKPHHRSDTAEKDWKIKVRAANGDTVFQIDAHSGSSDP